MSVAALLGEAPAVIEALVMWGAAAAPRTPSHTLYCALIPLRNGSRNGGCVSLLRCAARDVTPVIFYAKFFIMLLPLTPALLPPSARLRAEPNLCWVFDVSCVEVLCTGDWCNFRLCFFILREARAEPSLLLLLRIFVAVLFFILLDLSSCVTPRSQKHELDRNRWCVWWLENLHTTNYLLTATYYTKLPSFSRLTLTRNEHHPKPRPRYVTFPSAVLSSVLCVCVLMYGALNVTIMIFRLAPAGKGVIILSKNNLSILF